MEPVRVVATLPPWVIEGYEAAMDPASKKGRLYIGSPEFGSLEDPSLTWKIYPHYCEDRNTSSGYLDLYLQPCDYELAGKKTLLTFEVNAITTDGTKVCLCHCDDFQNRDKKFIWGQFEMEKEKVRQALDGDGNLTLTCEVTYQTLVDKVKAE